MEEKVQAIKKWLGTGSLNIFGMPFAGKDTQGEKLAEYFNGVIVSGGDVMRHAKDNQAVQQAMASGGLVPSELFEEIVLPHLTDPEHHDRPLILSEVGRMDGEQQVIVAACDKANHHLKAVVYLVLDDEDVYERFRTSQASHDRGDRQDDRLEVLQTRISSYKNKVVPVLNWYKEQGLLVEVDGRLPKGQVTENIISGLYERASK